MKSLFSTRASGTEEAERLSQTQHHELRNAAAFSGLVVGATVGMAGGVAGSFTAALIGGLIGALGGIVLERESWRREFRDRQLDREVGVTGRALGAKEAAVNGARALEEAARAERRSSELELLKMDAELDRAPLTPRAVLARLAEVDDADVPKIEPACPDCLDVRRESAGSVMWCARHSGRHVTAHLHYEYPRRYGVGSMFFRPA